jgi:hypothetical protein
MDSVTVTCADMAAYNVLHPEGSMITTDFTAWEYIEAGNKIIELAERIKAQRLAIAMQKRNNNG